MKSTATPILQESNVFLNTNSINRYGNFLLKLNNPEMITTLQNNLFDTVKDTYSLNKVTEQRRELYQNLVNKMDEKKNKLQPLVLDNQN